jgi:hypothetical protein
MGVRFGKELYGNLPLAWKGEGKALKKYSQPYPKPTLVCW